MKLFRYYDSRDRVIVGAFDEAVGHRDLRSYQVDLDENFWGMPVASQILGLTTADLKRLPELTYSSLRFAPVLARPSKIIGVGLNYRAHAEETGAQVPQDPKLFMKASSALCGSFDPLVLPRDSTHTDYEVELAVVIAKRASYVSEASSLDYVAGYTLVNDYSEREYQKNRAGQFVKGKSADTFCPLGPYFVPATQISPADLRLWLKVNGSLRQDSSTSDMVFSVEQLVSRISEYMTLLPGDVICTGTPSGVGLGMRPPQFLRPGDLVEYGIEDIATTRQLVQKHPLTRE